MKTKRFPCKICTKTFARNWNLTNHMKVHQGGREKIECPDSKCRKLCSNFSNLKQHALQFHQLSISSNDSFKRETVQTSFNTDLPTCKKCKRSFPKQYNLQVHIAAYHRARKAIAACKCGVSFTSLANLSRHQSTCTEHKAEGSKKNRDVKSKAKMLENGRSTKCKAKTPKNGRDELETGIVTVESNKYSASLKQQMQIEMPKCICRPESGCDGECINRKLYYECDENCPCTSTKKSICTNTQIQKGESQPLQLFSTNDKGFGVKTLNKIKAGSFIIEYTGEVITEKQLKMRIKQEYCKDKHQYSVSIGNGFVIDSRQIGNLSRFINHGCHPNCAMEKWIVNGLPAMAVFALEDIEPETEICYDYKYSPYNKKEKTVCHCGHTDCRGYIEAIKSPSDADVNKSDGGFDIDDVGSDTIHEKNAVGFVGFNQNDVERSMDIVSTAVNAFQTKQNITFGNRSHDQNIVDMDIDNEVLREEYGETASSLMFFKPFPTQTKRKQHIPKKKKNRRVLIDNHLSSIDRKVKHQASRPRN